jgi:hypothetical protein
MTSLRCSAGHGPPGHEENCIASQDEGTGPTSLHRLGVAETACVARYFALPPGIPGGLGPITDMESVSINRTAARLVAGQGVTQSARTPAPLDTLRKARSQVGPGIWRGKAWSGRAGQAFALVEFGVVDRATANSSPRTTTGHKQDDQTAKTKPPAGSCSRILDQSLGSTRARSKRNRPLE